MVEERIARIRENISQICKRLGKNPEHITLVGVTKFASLKSIQEALHADLTDLGENKVQEAQKKFLSLDPVQPIVKHMIGHLQTNKVKVALKIFDLIQSVDSLKLALEIDKQAQKLQSTVNILLQVNCSGEEQKYGIAKEEALKVIDELTELNNVRLQGLMTIAPFVEDQEIIRRCFKDLKNISDQVAADYRDARNIEMKYLSMGMTHDYEIALQEGSNMIRIGRAIFADEQ